MLSSFLLLSSRHSRPRGEDLRLIGHTSPNMDQVDLIWQNGEFVPWEDAKAHVLSHGLHYGTGVFEGIRCYETERGPAIFRHADHLDRLAEVGRALLPGAALLGRADRAGDPRADRPQRPRAPATSARSPSAATASLGLYANDAPIDVDRRRLALGRLPRRGGPEARHPRQGLELAPDQPRRLDPARQGLRPVPQLDPRQDRVGRTPATTRRSCSTSAASSARARARTSSWSATARS